MTGIVISTSRSGKVEQGTPELQGNVKENMKLFDEVATISSVHNKEPTECDDVTV